MNSSFVMTVRTSLDTHTPSSSSLSQNSGCISISMAMSIPQRVRLNGRLLRIISRAIRPTCSSSIRASSRYDIQREGGCARSSMVRAYDALGMDTDHRYHYPGLTQMGWGEKLLCQGLPCAVSCTPTGMVHLISRVLQCSVFLSSYRRSPSGRACVDVITCAPRTTLKYNSHYEWSIRTQPLHLESHDFYFSTCCNATPSSTGCLDFALIQSTVMLPPGPLGPYFRPNMLRFMFIYLFNPLLSVRILAYYPRLLRISYWLNFKGRYCISTC